MNLVIGLGHRSEMGKDTFSFLLAKHFNEMGLRTHQISFAAKLYEICHDLWGWAGFKTKEYYDQNKIEKTVPLPLASNKTPRELLIEVGNYLRQVHESVWIDYALFSCPSADVTIISDVRYPNEVAMLRAQPKHFLVKVHAPGVPFLDTVADNALEDHEWWDYLALNEMNMALFDDLAKALAHRLVQEFKLLN